MTGSPRIPVSWGELIDKITILEIKSEQFSGEALANVRNELSLLQVLAEPAWAEIADLAAELRAANTRLWGIEDRIRECEAASDFGPDFIALARAIYRTNDARGEIKRRINLRLKSPLIEEKGYRPY